MDRRPRQLRYDLRVLALFIELYCRGKHAGEPKEPASLATLDVAEIAGRSPWLCASCRKLLAHAFVKRIECPMDPKPACKACPDHCYHPTYRERIREVMRYSGRRIVWRAPLALLRHWWQDRRGAGGVT